MITGNILIVDDNKSILTALKLLLKGRYEEVKTLSSPNQLISELQKTKYNVLLLDMNFNAGLNTGNEGIYWLQRVLEFNPRISVIMITAYGDVELAVKAVKLGAVDFIPKPWDNDKLLATIDSALKLNQSRNEVKKLKQKEQSLIAEINKSKKNLIGSSETWNRVMKMVAKVAQTDANVLITGENGTGKDLVAHEIHRLSKRQNKVMVTVDMGSIPETLFESELFGHKKGAFTDAKADRNGKIETANEGTLFLDEIGNLSISMQSKLLSVLQNRKVTKVGGNVPIEVDLRLICATNCNLDQMVADNEFREDLFYRINTIQIELPSLRERIDDIRELATFFLSKYSRKYNRGNLSFEARTIDKLESYSWPGNVRELQHSIEKAVILCDGNSLKPSDFIFRNASESDVVLNGTLEEVEMKLIEKAIQFNNGNMSAAANQLGVTRQTLYNKLRKHGL